MSDDSGPQDLYTPAQQREHLDAYGIRDPLAHPNAGIVQDPLVNRFLGVLSNSYDPTASDRPGDLPGRAADLDEVERISAVSAAERHREALADGDMQTLKHLTGQQDQRADVSGLKAIGKIDELINGPAPILVIIGEPGAGKTNFACMLAQRYCDDNPGTLVASNVRTLRETTEWTDKTGIEHDGWTGGFPEFKEWLRHEGNPTRNEQTPKLGLLDELSSHAGGSGKAGQLTRKYMGPLVFKVRKFGGALIVIAHDEASIHPLLTRLGLVIKKTSQKKAVVYDRIVNGRPKGKRFEVEGIPPTDWRYDDKEETDWYWKNEEAEDDSAGLDEADVKQVAAWTMVTCRNAGLSTRQIAEYVPYGKTTVGNWLDDIDDGGEKADWVDTVDAIIA